MIESGYVGVKNIDMSKFCKNCKWELARITERCKPSSLYRKYNGSNYRITCKIDGKLISNFIENDHIIEIFGDIV